MRLLSRLQKKSSGWFAGVAAVTLMSVAAWAAVNTAGEVLVRGLGTEARARLAQLGLKSSNEAIWSSFELSLRALGKNNKIKSTAALKTLLGNDPVAAKILDKGLDKVTKAEFAQLHDIVVKKADRLPIGDNLVGAELCQDPEAKAAGFRILARSLDAKSSKLIAGVPTGAELPKSILNKVKVLANRSKKADRLVVTGITETSLAKLSVEEQQGLHVALTKAAEVRSKEEALFKAIQQFNGPDITQPRLWMVLAEDIDPTNMERLATVLKMYSNKDKEQRIVELRAWFGNSADTDELRASMTELKRRNCWGLF